ncbi:hypothetical protein WMY93_004069 [Mugilogobius chulae]|uniref:Uncharacterized protein n=1 Tax=Mugilogobius chulae TaxID=88201 RepID=A0AAW0PQ76_9GOBI
MENRPLDGGQLQRRTRRDWKGSECPFLKTAELSSLHLHPPQMKCGLTLLHPSLHRLRSKLRKKRMLHHPQPTMMLLDLLPLLLSVSGNNATCHKKQSTTLCLEFNSTKLFSSMCFGRECRKFLSSILK